MNNNKTDESTRDSSHATLKSLYIKQYEVLFTNTRSNELLTRAFVIMVSNPILRPVNHATHFEVW